MCDAEGAKHAPRCRTLLVSQKYMVGDAGCHEWMVSQLENAGATEWETHTSGPHSHAGTTVGTTSACCSLPGNRQLLPAASHGISVTAPTTTILVCSRPVGAESSVHSAGSRRKRCVGPGELSTACGACRVVSTATRIRLQRLVSCAHMRALHLFASMTACAMRRTHRRSPWSTPSSGACRYFTASAAAITRSSSLHRTQQLPRCSIITARWSFTHNNVLCQSE